MQPNSQIIVSGKAPPAPKAAPVPAPVKPASNMDDLLVLINSCVDALNLMQDRMTGLEEHARKAGDSLARDKIDTRADLSTLRTRIKLVESSVDQVAVRISTGESTGAELSSKQSRELAAARAAFEAEGRRVDTLDARLSSMEIGLHYQLGRSEADLEQAAAEAHEMRVQAERNQAAAAASERKLLEATAALADQRARIACLQSKLIAATQAMRMVDTSLPIDERGTTPSDLGDSIIDLADSSDDLRISAA